MASFQPDRKEESPTDLTLFGGKLGWSAKDWTASDDRVRGGESQSHLELKGDTARFNGILDVEALGGAGFASQRTTGDDRKWDLSDYAGIQLKVKKGDKKRYTFILKDSLLPPDETTAREQATISWECDFELPPQTEPGESHNKCVFMPWDSFNPTYRGKLKKDADPLDVKKIRRMSLMMRSFFGTQEGEFSLTLDSISALAEVPSSTELLPYHPRSLEAGANVEQSSWLSSMIAASLPKTWILVLGILAIGMLVFRNK